MSRPHLVVVRAGDKSLHPQWLSSQNRTWDLAVSCYGRHPQRYVEQYDLLHVCPGSKWQGLNQFLDDHPELLRPYQYVWFPDDDLLTTTENINLFFSWCERLDWVIAQPALTRNSYYGWQITRQVADVVARRTNFVEIMAPCFKVSEFRPYRPTFAENSSGYGLEWLWLSIAEKHGHADRLGIVDCTPVYHTRPVGSAGSGGAAAAPCAEMLQLFKRHGLHTISPTVGCRYVLGGNPNSGPQTN